MNYLEKNLVNDTVLTGGLLAVAMTWIVLAAASLELGGAAGQAGHAAVAVRVTAPSDAGLSLHVPVLAATKVS